MRRVCWWRGEEVCWWRGEEGMLVEGEWRGEEGMLVGVRRGCCDAVFCPHFVMCSSYHNWKQRRPPRNL